MMSRSRSALVIGALGALGVLAWSGCGPGTESRYYCDGSGCFTCDAYGCSRETPPTPPACSGVASCESDQVCTSTGCRTICKADQDCPKGEACQPSGLCSEPGVDPGATKECTTKADCSDGKVCAGGKCESCGGTDGPCPCTKSADCSDGLVCVAGSCTAPKDTCKYSSECGPDKLCADGQCLSSCEAAACGEGFTCEKGVCKPSTPPTPACTSDAQCTDPAAPSCVGGSCVKSCAADAECGAGRYCNQGACVVDTRPKPNCTADDQCGGTSATPKKCLAGFCKYTCTDDQHCRTIDSRIGYCAKDGVCRSSAEANASCVGPDDCAPGQSCVDNACR